MNETFQPSRNNLRNALRSRAQTPLPPGREPNRGVRRGRRAALAGLLFAVSAASLVLVPMSSSEAAPAVTPRTQAPPEARALSRAFAATAKVMRPVVVRLDVETGSQRSKKRVPRGHQNVPDFFRRFFDFGEGFPAPGPGRGTGSGVVLDASGNVLTNSHVVKNATKVTVLFQDGGAYEAEVVGKDDLTDVAVVRMISPPKSVTAARLGDSDKLEVGEWVLAVGSPLGLAQTVTAGIVSGTGKVDGRMRMSGQRVRRYIQTDAKINPGNSGGPLVNLDGEVIGINTLINTGPGGAYGFAIPINQAQRVAEALIRDGRMRYAFLGVSIVDADDIPAEARQGQPQAWPEQAAVVQQVTGGSPAEKAGLRPGDAIVRIDSKTIQGAADVVSYISQQPIGGKVKVVFLRAGKEKRVSVTLAELPSKDAPLSSRDLGDEARVGIAVQTLTPEMARLLGLPDVSEGVVITEVTPGSRADRAGLRADDVILKLNKRPVKTAEQVIDQLKQAIRKAHLLHVRRQGRVVIATVPAA